MISAAGRATVGHPVGGGLEGGLAGALNAALRKRGGIWFGWSGQECETFTGALNVQTSDDAVTTATIDLETQDIEEYYNGYANSTLWPLFHYRIDLTEYEREFGKGYERVNERFAEAVAPLCDPDSCPPGRGAAVESATCRPL